MKRNTIGINPLDAVIPLTPKAKLAESIREVKVQKTRPQQPRQRITFQLRTDLIERLRDTAYWLRRSMNEIVEKALIGELAIIDKKEKGGIPKRGQARLAPGRKVRG